MLLSELRYGEVRRIPLPRTPVNKHSKLPQWHALVPESVKVLPATGTNFHS